MHHHLPRNPVCLVLISIKDSAICPLSNSESQSAFERVTYDQLYDHITSCNPFSYYLDYEQSLRSGVVEREVKSCRLSRTLACFSPSTIEERKEALL